MLQLIVHYLTYWDWSYCRNVQMATMLRSIQKVVHFCSSKHFLSLLKNQDKTKYSTFFQRLHRLLLSRLLISFFRKPSSENGRLKYERAAKGCIHENWILSWMHVDESTYNLKLKMRDGEKCARKIVINIERINIRIAIFFNSWYDVVIYT